MSTQSLTPLQAIKQKLPIVKNILSRYDIPDGAYTFSAYKNNNESQCQYMIIPIPSISPYFTESLINDLGFENIIVKNN